MWVCSIKSDKQVDLAAIFNQLVKIAVSFCVARYFQRYAISG